MCVFGGGDERVCGGCGGVRGCAGGERVCGG